MIKNSPSNARNVGLIPHDTGQLSLVPQLLSLHITTLLKPPSLEAMLYTREAAVIRSPYTTTKNSLRLLQLEKAVHSNEDPVQPKNKRGREIGKGERNNLNI